MSEIKVSVDGKDVLVRDVEIIDGFAVLKFGENEVKIPVEEWKDAN
jgi:hypothetical protein